jgi:uncharacterized protein
MDLSAVAIYDHHAHPPRRWDGGLSVAQLRACFAMGSATADHVPHTVVYRRALRDLAELYDCAPNEAAISAARAAHAPATLIERALERANLSAVLIDDGYVDPESIPFNELRTLMPCPLGRILRVEALAEALMAQHPGDFAAFDAAYRAALADLRRQGVVALKSIAAYRCGLRLVSDVRYQYAASAYEDEHATATEDAPLRITNVVLISYLVMLALDEAARQGVPFQFHTGIGDEDIDLRTASPLHLRDLFTQERYREVPFVLLHSYPAVRDVAYMARVFPHVYMDLSLTSLFTAHGAAQVWREALELAPASKLLWGSDAFFLPELFYLAARYGRLALGGVLADMVREQWLLPSEAERFAQQILFENARGLYGVV